MHATMESGPMPAGIPFPEYYDFFMNWKTPLAIAATYCISVGLFNPKVGKVSRVVAKSANAKPAEKSQSGAAMTAFVFFHNLVLCIYSAITFYNMFPAMIRNFSTHTLHDAVSYIFYLGVTKDPLDIFFREPGATGQWTGKREGGSNCMSPSKGKGPLGDQQKQHREGSQPQSQWDRQGITN